MTRVPLPPRPRISRRGGARTLSVAWLVPLVALVIAGTVAWRHYASLGPTIRIALEGSGGIEAGRTEIRYRGVPVGIVEDLALGPEMKQVIAVARLDASVAGALREDTVFWLTQPRISASEISGIDTLLGGVYLGVSWGEGPRSSADRFTALPEPPPTPPGTPGRRVTLVSEAGGSIVAGAPVLYKTIEVGVIERKRLSESGDRLLFDAFVRAPHHERIVEGTRFWDRSGVAVNVGAEGFSLQVGALASILRGGVEFDTVGEDPPSSLAAADHERFKLFPSREAAAESLFSEDPLAQVRVSVRFRSSVRGLSTGAPVEFRGVTVGEVEGLSVRGGETLGDVRVVATLLLQPARLGIETDDPARMLDFIDRSVRAGLRAKLSVGSLLTGALFVELTEIDPVEAAGLDRDARPYPRMPSVQSDFEQLQGGAQDLLVRFGELPVEETFTNLNSLLANLRGLSDQPALQGLPAEISALVESTGAIAEDLRAAGLADRLDTTLADAGAATAALSSAAERLPELARRLEAVADRAGEVIAAYGAGSKVNTEALTALREIREAGRAISSLAQALERRPNSLILGR